MSSFKKIGEILREKGFITELAVTAALEASARDGLRFGESCIRLGLVNEDQLAEAVAEQYGLDIIDISAAFLDEEAVKVIPAELLLRAVSVPIKSDGPRPRCLVTSDPTDILNIDKIARFIEGVEAGPVRLAVATRSSVEKLLNRSHASGKALEDASTEINVNDLKMTADKEGAAISLESIAANSSPVVKLVESIIYDAVSKRASDIHLETCLSGLTVKYRIDGVLREALERIDKRVAPSVISRIKVMSELDISERRTPQDGRFHVKMMDKGIDLRVSIMPSIHGEDAVIRILDKSYITQEFEGLRLDSLGFRDNELQHLRRLIREPYGMVLVTGPTGSGKTTTLYAALSEINTGEDKIITIEDPVEYQLKGVAQIAVNEKKGLTFARGLRSILRHDPDKIMVGEIRDSETAEIAIQAALTGHLVFTTVHANNVFDVIGRFSHMGIEPYNFVSSLNCILAQRLVRLICNKCRRPANVDKKTLVESGLDAGKYMDTVFYEGAGCDECNHTGYRGRKAVAELLDLSDEIRDIIASRKSIAVIKKKAVEEGMETLRQAAIKCVMRGETTFREINRVTFVE